MSITVTILRVFTDANGDFGNPLGVVDAAAVAPDQRQGVAAALGYSETIFIDIPEQGESSARAHIFTPTTELPFAGHPTVGASWWLDSRGTPVHTLQVPAGIVAVSNEGGKAAVSARAEWAPEFAIHDLDSVDALLAADIDEYPDDDISHYLWTWLDKDAGALRARMFAPNLGVPEDEATGAAAVRMTDYLSRDLSITQGKGSKIETQWHPDGWVKVAGRVVDDGTRQL